MKPLNEMKLGEILEEDMFCGALKKPIKLVKITYTFQDKNETQADMGLIHKDYVELDEEEPKKAEERFK